MQEHLNLRMGEVMPAISLYTLAYNGERFLQQCVQSVLSQSFTDFEYIIVLNGVSADNTKYIVEQLAQSDSRIVIVTNEGQDTSISAGRLLAFSSIRGEYLTDLDQDDILPRDALLQLYNLAVKSHADIVSGRVERVYSGSKKIIVGMQEYDELTADEYLPIAIQYMDYLMHGKLYRASLLRSHAVVGIEGLYDGEDILYHFQFACHAKKVVMLNEVVYTYSVNQLSSSQNLNLQRLGASFRVFVFLGEFFEKEGKYESCPDLSVKYSAFFLVRLAVVLMHGNSDFYYANNNVIHKYLRKEIISDDYVRDYLRQYGAYYILLRAFLISPLLGGLLSHLMNSVRIWSRSIRKR